MTPTPASPRPQPETRELPFRVRKRRPSVYVLVWLTLVWVLLWGDITIGNLVAGLMVAVIVTMLVPLPRVPFAGRIRPVGVARLVARFAYDVVVASVHVSAVALGRRPPEGAVIRVRLRAHSDLFLHLTASFTSLVPGSIVVEAHRVTGTLYVHIFDVRTQGGLANAERAILAQEERILRALASDDQLIDAGYAPGASPRRGRLPASPGVGDEDGGQR